jgi:N,N'-diacetyllegionaminate synthase
MKASDRVLVIAEIGVNHNGDPAMARALIDAAAAAGADLAKFQTFQASSLATASAPKADYQQRTTPAGESQQDMIRKLELDHAQHHDLMAYCKSKGIGFFSTGFDAASLDFLASIGLALFKIPSGEVTNLPYLRQVASFGKPLLLSTGMAEMEEIAAALKVLELAGAPRSKITVLHCNTAYPTPVEDVNLRAMNNIREAFGVDVGYSDHTPGIEVAIAAAALGAAVIEKHLTLDRTLPGPDHAASLEPGEFAEMVRAIRNIERALGDGAKRATASEKPNKVVARRSLVAARAIEEGELFTPLNVTAKRPGKGLSPMEWDRVMGRPAPRSFAPDEPIALAL